MAVNNTILIGARTEPTEIPPIGKVYIWMGANGHLYGKNDAGIVIDMGESATEYSNLLAMTDTPASYNGNAGKHMLVNAAETGVEFEEVKQYWEDGIFNSIRSKESRHVTIGTPESGAFLMVGEGTPYNDEVIYKTELGGTFADITSDLITMGDGNVGGLPATLTNAALYIGVSKQSSDYLKHYGLYMNVLTATDLGSGSIAIEYYNGAWLDFSHMLTQANYPSQSFGNSKIEETGLLTSRYDALIDDDWTKTTIDGDERYWIRFRVTSPITTAFVLDFLAVTGSIRAINSGGEASFFGKARPVKKVNIMYGSLEAANNSPSNMDIGLSDYLVVGLKENLFKNGSVQRTAFTKILNFDTDTSTPLKLVWKWSVNSNGSGSPRFVIRWGTSRPNESIYFSTQGGSSAPDQQSMIIAPTIAANNRRKEFQNEAYLYIDHVIPEISNSEYTSIWVSIERTGNHALDTFEADLAIHEMQIYYVAWRDGNNLNNY